ncbi:MAG: hypothetical protein CMB56_005780 [Methanobacteriota archaeon]|nr:MAG: hypothetical protein CMB56_005780 [Euryarchaeota archaeon]|tara:strand:- start:2234 stop:2491 length:258 start_codon:yes stop_codon:yes gene_type:complete
MSDKGNLPDVIQGLGEPESSKVVLTIVGILALGILAISTQAFSLFGGISPFSGLFGTNSIWWFMLGIFVSIATVLASIVGEVFRE